ncbi:TolB family protein [Paenibacillus sp. Leaf72]|uniref:TolB family protein n=1 Tax=Paenibacillus sp. Leaf72 TaxID=1736234 RepID=UPI0006F7D781|nr:DPP IV N-terminal domain-containing protein [Paenibacillus sp. Leaf72]KQO18106.1 hypothetical protein ASF12_05555 [Paenibacillus sp. Leaf72]
MKHPYSIMLLLLILLTVGCSSSDKAFTNDIVARPDHNGTHYSYVNWSPDGQQISYIQDRNLWIKNMKSGKSRKLVSGSSISHAAWMNADQIAYFTTTDSNSLQGELGAVTLDSRKKTILFKNIAWFNTLSIHNQIAYLETGKQGVLKLNLSESLSEPDTLDPNLTNGSEFALSPDGSKLLYLEKTEERSINGIFLKQINIYDINERATKQVQLSKLFEVIYSYCWSADGSHLAFAAQYPGQPPNLYIYKIDSKAAPSMLPFPENAGYMAWSPTQNQIVYTTVGQPSGNEIRVIDIPDELL